MYRLSYHVLLGGLVMQPLSVQMYEKRGGKCREVVSSGCFLPMGKEGSSKLEKVSKTCSFLVGQGLTNVDTFNSMCKNNNLFGRIDFFNLKCNASEILNRRLDAN